MKESMEATRVPQLKYDPNDLFRFIVRYNAASDGNSPTYRDIMRGCRISSVSVVHYHLHKLARQGRIRLSSDGSARAIVVVGGSWVAPQRPRRRMEWT